MEWPFILLAATAFFLLPFGVEAQTGGSKHKKYLSKNARQLSQWKKKFLENYFKIRIANSAVLSLSALFILVSWKNGSGLSLWLPVFLFIAGAIFAMAQISWPAWIQAKWTRGE